ncbi:glycosyltransferase family 4 protein [Photobacterium sp. MCCC 1A19761]|uniref:glycosyltransferase family 4 protein n=1 Tax=Photobacterium sp. MCCC 1A19761 TaxID=3115000 RepID=UPI00307CDA30
MKVMLFLDSSGFGGIESHVLQLAMMLHQRQVAVEVMFFRHYPRHPLYARLAQAGVRYRFARGSLTVVRRMLSELAATDTLHAHGYKASVLARLFKPLCAARVVTTFHAGETGDRKVRCYEWLNRFTAPLSDNLAVSESIRARVGRDCKVVRNFIDTRQVLPRTERTGAQSPLRFAFVGRLSHEKGLDRYLACARLFPDHQWHVFGDGPQAALLNEAPNCIVHGAVASMQAYWSAIDVLVMPSRQEGLPMAAIEAMAHGTLVIATQVGQLSDLVDHRFLVPEPDWQQIPALIDVIAGWEPGLWQDFQRRAQHRVETQFSAGALWREYQAIYRYRPAQPSAETAAAAQTTPAE